MSPIGALTRFAPRWSKMRRFLSPTGVIKSEITGSYGLIDQWPGVCTVAVTR